MNKEEKEALYNRAITTWGHLAQLEMAQEEGMEFALAVRRFVRGKKDAMENVIDEMADVEIMIEQIKFMYPEIVQSVESRKTFKLNRLSERLDKHQK